MSYLAEALRTLNEEEFDISTAGLEDLTDFVDNTDAINKLNAIDTEAREQSELADSYVGKVILQCNVCHELIYKDPEDVVVGEDGDLVNIDEECPICLSTDGYKIIGQVGEYGDPENSTTVTVDSDGNTEDVSGEALGESLEFNDKDSLTHEIYQKILPLLKQYTGKGLTLDDLDSIFEEVSYHLESEDEISFAEDDDYYYDNSGRLRKKYDVDAAMEKFDSLKENIEHVNIETDTQVLDMGEDENGKVQVTTEPKADTLEPVDAGTEDQFQYNTEEEEEPSEEEVGEEDYEDVEPEEFDEESFDELGESYLKEAYDNVRSYKTTSVSMNDNNLIVEGLITFDTGSKKKTSFVFESYQKVNGKFKFLGENIQITPNKKSAFSLRTRLDNGRLVCEALRYNYKGCSGVVVNEGEDLSKRTNSLTHAIEPIISKLQGLNKSEVYDLVNKTIKDARMEKVPGAQRLLDRIQKARSDYDAQSAVTNSYLAGGNDAVINLKKKYH